MNSAEALLTQYDDCEVTLSPLGNMVPGIAAWVDTAIHADLRSAALQVIEEDNRRAPYSVMVHMPGRDIPLSYAEFDEVVQQVAAERRQLGQGTSD